MSNIDKEGKREKETGLKRAKELREKRVRGEESGKKISAPLLLFQKISTQFSNGG